MGGGVRSRATGAEGLIITDTTALEEVSPDAEAVIAADPGDPVMLMVPYPTVPFNGMFTSVTDMIETSEVVTLT